MSKKTEPEAKGNLVVKAILWESASDSHCEQFKNGCGCASCELRRAVNEYVEVVNSKLEARTLRETYTCPWCETKSFHIKSFSTQTNDDGKRVIWAKLVCGKCRYRDRLTIEQLDT